MSRKWIDFEAVYDLASIEQLADMLNLSIKKEGVQLRCKCPIHGGDERTLAITPSVRSKKGNLGVFFCQKSQSGGDRIALVAHCMDIGQQDAAFFITEQFGEATVDSKSNSTVSKNRAKPTKPVSEPESERGEEIASASSPQSSHSFDPVAFGKKLQYDELVKKLGISEEDANSLGIGSYRGKLYQALRWPNGDVAGFSSISFTDGEFKLPAKLVPMSSNVVKFPKTA